MMRVHFIKAGFIRDLESSVNAWLQINSEVEVIDIKYEPVPCGHIGADYSVMIIYK